MRDKTVSSFLRICGGFENADFCTRASLALIEVVEHLLTSFKVCIVFNYNGLVYFNAVQHCLWSGYWFCNWVFGLLFDKKFCQQSRFAF